MYLDVSRRVESLATDVAHVVLGSRRVVIVLVMLVQHFLLTDNVLAVRTLEYIRRRREVRLLVVRNVDP